MSLLRSWKIKGDGATTKISPLTGLAGRCRTAENLGALENWLAKPIVPG